VNEASPKAMDKQDKQMDKAIMQLELEGIKEGIEIQVGTSALLQLQLQTLCDRSLPSGTYKNIHVPRSIHVLLCEDTQSKLLQLTLHM
jgi:hypothetical protein